MYTVSNSGLGAVQHETDFHEGNLGITIICPVKNHSDLISDSEAYPKPAVSECCKSVGYQPKDLQSKTCNSHGQD